jgi:hypothetical protein
MHASFSSILVLKEGLIHHYAQAELRWHYYYLIVPNLACTQKNKFQSSSG